MIEYKLTTIAEMGDSLPELINKYWVEVDERRDEVAVAVDMEFYNTLEVGGSLRIISAFDGEKIVGFLPFIESYDLHVSGALKASAELIYVLPEYRGMGIASALLREAQGASQAHYFFFTLKTYAPHNQLVLNNGFQHVENIYMKVL